MRKPEVITFIWNFCFCGTLSLYPTVVEGICYRPFRACKTFPCISRPLAATFGLTSTMTEHRLPALLEAVAGSTGQVER